MEKSSFFNAQIDASGEYDRSYLAEDFASYFSRFISNGVFPNPSTGLQVLASEPADMSVTLSVGYAYINGYKYENTSPLKFNIDVADGVLNRKDAIFIRFNKLGRAINAYKAKGNPGSSAVTPSVIRNEDYWDLCVGIINVNAGVTAIPQSLIEDTRLNTSLCGIVTGLVEQVDTTTLYSQIQSDLAEFKTVSQAEFNAWFEDINSKLGTEPATALQQQVDALDAAKMDKTTYDSNGDGVVDKAAVADKVAKKLILQNNAGQQMAEFDGSEEKTVKLTPVQVGAEPAFTKNNAFNKNFGSAAGTVCQGNDGRLSNARRASNISMSLSGTTLTINYS